MHHPSLAATAPSNALAALVPHARLAPALLQLLPPQARSELVSAAAAAAGSALPLAAYGAAAASLGLCASGPRGCVAVLGRSAGLVRHVALWDFESHDEEEVDAAAEVGGEDGAGTGEEGGSEL